MERKKGWYGLEDAVRTVRDGADEGPRAWFEVARARLYEIDAVDLIRTIAPLLPGTTFAIIEDFDQAGGRGFPPRVALKGPKRSIDPRTIEVDTLSVHPVVSGLSIARVVVSREERKKHGRKPRTHTIWTCDVYDRDSLARDILEGVKQSGLPNINLAAVEKALGLAPIPRTLKRP